LDVQVPKSGDHVLATYESEQESSLIVAEEVEALVRASSVVLGFAELVEALRSSGRSFECSDKFQIAAIGGGDESPQVSEAVAGFLEGSELEGSRAVPLFHRAVVLEKETSLVVVSMRKTRPTLSYILMLVGPM